jgi:hypothetical protein
MKPFLLNPARLSFQIADVLGGMVMRGLKGESRFFGNGDCVLIDGATGLIGVADGTERSPGASRRFLSRMAENVRSGRLAAGEVRLRHFREAAREVLEGFHYEDRSTFVCLLPVDDEMVLYLCGGDSILMQLDVAASRVVFRNRPNMGFTGRCRDVVDFGRRRTKKGDLFLLGTDGLWDLAAEGGEALVRVLFMGLKTDPVHRLPDQMIRMYHPAFRDDARNPYDDFGMVLVDPANLSMCRSRILLGGTSADAEMQYRRHCRGATFPNRYLEVPEEDAGLWTFPDSLPRAFHEG